MKIEHIETEKGEEIINTLKKAGWKVSDQYNWFAFEKGIDFDSYTLKKGEEELSFEWSNWFSWRIQGTERLIHNLMNQFELFNTAEQA
ncbi:hypothetical protein OAP63_05745 [Vibrio sp.]|uniref:Uncharacterized protein n=1 Tax=Vibrio viridaestus TaxID=2487322 RepID=A0A3N9U2R9_9VIBR|nr:hypothetical protein [Vibrio viridaestus]MDC0610217.1 hypothetical protein [Vibrio sp.]RQW62246.1 hypothetical protein EES38_16155 [Vibrio viridaestus]